MGEEERVFDTVRPRYGDVSQTGRFRLESIPPLCIERVWPVVLERHPSSEEAIALGQVPILTRLVIEASDGSFSVVEDATMRGGYALAHGVRHDTGELDRIYLNMWGELAAHTGHAYSPTRGGPVARAGRVFAEHVFTRLFAPPAERKVTKLEGVRGLPTVPEKRYDAAPPRALREAPSDATRALAAWDSAPSVFGLDHTDSNQHVNSLVYPRMFVESALRVARRERFEMLAAGNAEPTAIELGFRRPSFAGDGVRFHVELHACPDRVVATGALYAEDDILSDVSDTIPRPDSSLRARVFVRATFRN